MFLRFSQTRLFIVLVLFLSLFALTACNRKDDGVSPAQTETKSTDALSQFMANIGNATFSIDVTPPEENPISPAQMLLQSDSSTLSMRKAVPKAAVAPNPNGSNLALSAVANASSYWPWPLYGFPFTPDHGNNGNMADCWAASFQYYSHWYRLDWTASQTIGRIYVSHAGTPMSTRGQTISSIRYYNQPTNSWLTIPGSNLTYGASKPMYVDFSFSPVQTTGIILYMNTGPENPHPNATVFISEIEVYGASGSLKITSPANDTVFNLGENITFTGEKTGIVNNIQWSSNLDGTIGNSFPSIATSGLRVGTHTITLSGQSSTGQNLSNSITVGIKGGKPRVMKIAFQSMNGQNNWNKIYDRKGDFRKSTFLDPIQWQGKIVANEVVQEFCYPISYVRSNAVSVGNGPSKLKILATFKDLEKAPSLNFTVNLTAKCKGNGVEKNLTFNSGLVSTSNDFETSKEFESIEGLPDVVGIWEMEFEWKFTSNGAALGTQKIPQAGIQNLYTVWEKPLDTGEYHVKIETIPGYFYCEEMPTYYLDVIAFSCYFLKDFGSEKTVDEIMTRNLVATYDRIAGIGYRYSTIIPIDGVTRRGLDRLLDETLKDGWCMEWGHLYKALNEAHGVNVYSVVSQLKQIYYGDGALVTDGIVHVAVGGTKSTDMAPPDSTRTLWSFKNHHYIVKSADTSSFDPTFSIIGPIFPTYLEDMFEYGNLVTTDVDLEALKYVDFYFSN